MKPPVDAGIGEGLTSAAGSGQFLLQTADPTIATGGNLRQTALGSVIVGPPAGVDPAPGESNGLRTVIGSNVVFPGATATDTNVGEAAVAAGGFSASYGMQASSTGGNATSVGTAAQAHGNSNTAVGSNSEASGAQTSSFGSGARNAASANNSIVAGFTALNQGGGAVVVGNNAQQLNSSFFAEAVIVGYNSLNPTDAFQTVTVGAGLTIGAAHSNTVMLGGRMTSDFARQFKVGFGASTNFLAFPIYGVFIGGPDTYGGYEGITYRHVNGQGTNDSVGPLQFVAPRGTGTGVAAVGGLTAGIEFYTGAPGASGTTIQAQTLQFKIHPSAGGAGVPAVEFLNVVNGAGAAVATFTNAPGAGGNPGFYLPVFISVAGVPTLFYIPCLSP